MALHVVVGVVLPLLVGLVTTRLTHPGVKAVLLLALTGATNVGAELAQCLMLGTPFRVVDVVVIAAAQFMWSTGVHFGLLKPGKVSDWLADHGRKAPELELRKAEQDADVVLTEGTVSKQELASELVDPALAGQILAHAAEKMGRDDFEVWDRPVPQPTNEQTMADYDTVARDRRARLVDRLGEDVDATPAPDGYVGRHRAGE